MAFAANYFDCYKMEIISFAKFQYISKLIRFYDDNFENICYNLQDRIASAPEVTCIRKNKYSHLLLQQYKHDR